MPTKQLRRRPLAIKDILLWATAFREATGRFPTKADGGIASTHFETWAAVDAALRDGLRGLPGDSSLAQLLADRMGYRNTQGLPSLTEQQILCWADQHHQRTGTWPTVKDGVIPETGGENWPAINEALYHGARGLPGKSSLARLLAQHRGVRNRKSLPPLTEAIILERADAHFQRTGAWPTVHAGPVADAPGETWLAADMALRHGRRGLPGGSSLAFLLAQHRKVRNCWTLPNLTVKGILAWADAWQQRTGDWPDCQSGAIPDSDGDTWGAVNHALQRGSRGLAGGLSLAELLALERGVRTKANLPNHTRKTILAWANAHHRRTGEWPTQKSGTILDAPGETWSGVDDALRYGHRGLRSGSSLARLLAQHRKKRNIQDQPPLSQKKILLWADAHHERTGAWPNINSGSVPESAGERWDLIDNALRAGQRGLPGGTSLRKLLAKRRGVRNPASLPPLTEEQIVAWALKHRERAGKLPKYQDGLVVDTAGETWGGVDSALRYGRRGLDRGSSLAKLLKSAIK